MKKILKLIGASILGIFAFLIIVSIITGISTTSGESTVSTEENAVIELDSIEIAKRERFNDSINAVKAKNKEIAEKKLKRFRVKKDEFKSTEFYQHKSTPKYTNVNFVYPYIGRKNEQIWLRFKMQYTAKDWLFIKSAIILVDGEKYSISGTWERDNNSTIWEWGDMAVNSDSLLMLEKIAKSKVAKIRYNGMKYHDDRILTQKEKNIIKETIDIYKGLI